MVLHLRPGDGPHVRFVTFYRHNMADEIPTEIWTSLWANSNLISAQGLASDSFKENLTCLRLLGMLHQQNSQMLRACTRHRGEQKLDNTMPYQ